MQASSEYNFEKHHRRRGFTLVEAIAAVVILAISVPPMMWAMREAHAQRVGPVQASKARWLATEKLEDIIADRHSTTRGYPYILNGNYPVENSITGFPGFTRSVSITETTANLVTAGTGYKRAAVTLGWTDVKGVARTLTVTSVVTDY